MSIKSHFSLNSFLSALPALLVFCFVLTVHDTARGQMGVIEPFVLVGPEAKSLAKALQPKISHVGKNLPANVVVIFPATPSAAHLVLVDTTSRQKFWTVIPLAILAEVMQQIGSPA